MRTTAYALSLFLVGASVLFAQASLSDSDKAFLDCAVTQCILGGAPTFNAPFSAQATTVWYPAAGSGQPELRATALYYRDGAGRVRVEQGFIGRDLRSQILLAPDANSRTAYVLDPTARTISKIARGLAQMMVGGGGSNSFVLARSKSSFFSMFQVPVDVESTGAIRDELGQRSMAGIQVTGARFAIWMPGKIGTGRGERWVSPELKLLVYSRSEYPQMGILEYELTTISRSEPKPELFDVPPNYMQTPMKYPLTWDGPASQNPALVTPSHEHGHTPQ
jgi:hypothetical protein